MGHETDILISDFVADVRAATPSNAMEIALPDSNEYRVYLDNLADQFHRTFQTILHKKEQELGHIKNLFEQNSFQRKFEFVQKEINLLTESFHNSFKSICNQKQLELNMLKENFKINNPANKNLDGFAQITKENKIINLSDVKKDDTIMLQTAKNIAVCQVLKNNKI